MSVKNVAVGLWKVAVSVRVPWKPYPVKRKATVKGTKADAKLKEAELLRMALDEGQGQGESSLKKTAVSTFNKVETLQDGINLYLEKLKAQGRLSAVTQRKYGWLGRELGYIPILELGERFMDWIHVYKNTVGRNGKPRTPATVNFVINVVKAVCNHLVELEILLKNPISRAKFPTASCKPRFVTLTQEEQDRLLLVIQREHPDILPIVKFMLQIPCRAFSELVPAKVSQLKDGMIFIPTSKNKDPIFKPVPISMADYFDSIPIQDGCQYLFYRKVGDQYLPLDNLRHAFEVCRKKADLPNLRIHDLRHVAVTNLVLRGVPVQLLMKLCGWRKDQSHVYCNISLKSGAEYFLNMEKEAMMLAS